MPASTRSASFDDDLADLTGKIVAMGGLVERQLVAAVEALVERDSAAAEQVVKDDDRIDELEEQIDQLVIRLLAIRQPMAVDLRVIAMALKISNDLERMGDYATNIAKRARRINVAPAAQAVDHHPADGGDLPRHGQGRAGRLYRARRRARRWTSGGATRRSTSTTISCSASC